MLCRKPYVIGTLQCPCGGCLPCRINRRRVWSHRILLESFKHAHSCFVTLTYDDEHVPAELVKSHYQNWLKRLRKAVCPVKIRYFVAGEYGDISGRPHFHAAVFGLDAFTAGGWDGRGGVCSQTWPYGFTFAGELTWESAQYIAGYLTKKVVHGEKSIREFSRMSLRPGLGSGAMDDVARVLSCDAGLDSVLLNGDVPSVLKHGKRLLPLGRYLRRQLRGKLGFASKDTPREAAKLYGLLQAAQASEERASLKAEGLSSGDAHKMILDKRAQRIHNFETRFLNRDSKRRLT